MNLVFTGLKDINHVAAHFDNRCMSLLSCSNCSSVLFLLKFSDITASSAYKCMSESRSRTMSFMYMRNRSGPSIDPCGTPAVTFCHFQEEPSRTTRTERSSR